MSICTLGLDPTIYNDFGENFLITQGYGPFVPVVVTVFPGTIGRGPTRRKREEEERLIRIRVISEDGKTMMQERLVPLHELDKIKIKLMNRDCS